MSYLQAAMYYFVYYVNDTNYEVLRNFPEDFRKFSEYLPKTFEDVSTVDQSVVARLSFNKGKHGS